MSVADNYPGPRVFAKNDCHYININFELLVFCTLHFYLLEFSGMSGNLQEGDGNDVRSLKK